MVRGETSTGSSWRGWSKSGREDSKASIQAWWGAFRKLNAVANCPIHQNCVVQNKTKLVVKKLDKEREGEELQGCIKRKIYVNQNLK